MTIVKTSVFQLEAPADDEPFANWAAIARRNSATMDAAMAQRVTPPGIPDLNAEIVARNAAIAAALDPLPRGRMVSKVTTAAGPQNVVVETLIDSVTFTAAAGRRYKLTYDLFWVCYTSVSTALFTVRHATGAAGTTPVVSTSSTQDYGVNIRAWAAGEFIHDPFTVELPVLPAGAVTLGFFGGIAIGTGTFSVNAGVTRTLIVEDTGK